ncbi:unnamed protein product [Triticum turgidum subsp. durum]|nr:unnamed protein product [Triticum turgidum subsp. durum]
MAHQAAAGGSDTRLRTCSWMSWRGRRARRVCAATSSASARSARPSSSPTRAPADPMAADSLRSGRLRRHWGLLGNVQLGQHQKIRSLFEEMKVENIKPDNLTCCLLMISRAALNKIDVGEVLKEMQENDVVPGWSAYSMASIYLSAGLV